jgi:kynurenine 3-monooxygenase
MPRVSIIGAGLAGSLLSIYLAKRGIVVDVYEARGDMRLAAVAAGRSINLALSDRGIAALREIEMDAYMLAEAVPMYGRMIHSPTGEQKLFPYSGRDGEYINSVSRAGLNIALINRAKNYPEVTFHFNRPCTGFDIESGEIVFVDDRISAGDTVIATDGAGSAIRQSMERQVEGFLATSRFLEHGYKELHIPSGTDGSFLLERNALHIWPRHQFMMIALPNFDGSFTCTLFLAKTGKENSFENLTNAGAVAAFFEREFFDAVPIMPALADDFFNNPTGDLGTLDCWPWNVDGKVLLLGDSAHAMVPFYGQGMNCAFEDVRILDNLIDKHGEDWAAVFNEYGEFRRHNTAAIQDMAEDNFYEMRDRVADPVFQRKRQLETMLEQTYPDYFSRYSMVTFREDLPYSVAKEKGNSQDRLLMEMCAAVNDVREINIDEAVERLREL